jgi:hypothetical protein
MTGKGSEALNPGQAIYDTLSDEAKAAVDALPDYPFIGPDAADKAEQLVATLDHINRSEPEIWSIQPDSNGDVELRVGKLKVVSCYRDDRLGLLVKRDEASAEPLNQLIDQYGTTWRSPAFPTFRRIVSTAQLRESLEYQGILHAHYIAADELISTEDPQVTKPRRPARHRDDWRVRLAQIVGDDVPAPAYISFERFGLSTPVPEVADRASRRIEPPVSAAISLSELQGGFEDAGLAYTAPQIASFYTALQTKGFVILSGISGTGKSKIAQRFAGMLPEIPVELPAPGEGSAIRIGHQPYMSRKGYIYLRKAIADALPVPVEGIGYTVSLSVDGVNGTGRIATRKAPTRGTAIAPHGQLKDAVKAIDVPRFDLRVSSNDDGTQIEHIAIVTTTDKRTEGQTRQTSNHLFLPVRPDWRDGKQLIGYHNPLTGEYVRTGFLDFAIAAADDYRAGSRNAFFVILDEMNLAHVEYYFADVLSVIESGRDEEGWTVEGIPLAVGDEDADLPERLHLPPNLYIVGTVNMDETTHPFSPKVLDRAFTIELTEVDFSDYPPEPVDGDASLDNVEREALLQAFTQNGRYPRIDKDDIRGVVDRHPHFRDDLHILNTSLKRYRMHFGYRVFDEIMQFVHNAERNGLFTPDEAFDHAVLMKVLPKFNGSRARLERPLIELLLWSRQAVSATEDDARTIATGFENYLISGKAFDSVVRDSDDWRYPATGKRAALMMQDLYTDGFAAFG